MGSIKSGGLGYMTEALFLNLESVGACGVQAALIPGANGNSRFMYILSCRPRALIGVRFWLEVQHLLQGDWFVCGGQDNLIPGANGCSGFLIIEDPFWNVFGGIPVLHHGCFRISDLQNPVASLDAGISNRERGRAGVFDLQVRAIYNGPSVSTLIFGVGLGSIGEIGLPCEQGAQDHALVEVISPVNIRVIFIVFFCLGYAMAGPEEVCFNSFPVVRVYLGVSNFVLPVLG